MAEGYLKSFMLPGVTVQSRGLYADGSPVSENAVKVMAECGIDISGHISSNISKNEADTDLFICVTATHEAYLIAAGIDREKILTLSNIPDPFGADTEVYRECRNKIFWDIDRIVFGSGLFSAVILPSEESGAEKMAELEKLTSSEPWSAAAITESMHASTLFYSAKVNGELAGYIGMSVAADEGYITNVAVFPEMRNRGIATLLLNRVLSEARRRKLSFVSLEVRESNETAERIYEKLGFKVEGNRKDFYRFPTENAIIMTRRF